MLDALAIRDAVDSLTTALGHALQRMHAALRPGGYALLGMYVRADDPLATALSDLRTVRQGGALRTPQELAPLLTRVGFVDVKEVFDSAWRSPLTFVAGRR